MAASEIRIRVRVPHPSSALLNNMLGVLGLVAIIVAVGGLAGWLWGLLAAGVVAVGLSLIGATYTEDAAAAALVDEPAVPDAAGAGAEPAVATIAAVPRSA